MTREKKEKFIESVKKDYEVSQVINKKGQDVASIDLGPMDIPKEFSEKGVGIPLIRKVNDQYHVFFSVQLGLNPEEKKKRLQARQKLNEKKRQLRTEIKELTKSCVKAIRQKDLTKAQELTAKIEQAESDLASL